MVNDLAFAATPNTLAGLYKFAGAFPKCPVCSSVPQIGPLVPVSPGLWVPISAAQRAVPFSIFAPTMKGFSALRAFARYGSIGAPFRISAIVRAGNLVPPREWLPANSACAGRCHWLLHSQMTRAALKTGTRERHREGVSGNGSNPGSSSVFGKRSTSAQACSSTSPRSIAICL